MVDQKNCDIVGRCVKGGIKGLRGKKAKMMMIGVREN